MTFPIRKGVALGLALAVCGAAASAWAEESKPREELRPIVAEYVESGDIDKALADLKKKKATPKELLATLRTWQRVEITGGERNIPLKDGHGRTTDLEVVAPATGSIGRAKNGVGLLVLLHGLKGNGRQVVPFAQQVVQQHPDVVVVAPSAQALPAGQGPEDGIPGALGKSFPHWWLYASPRSFPLEALKWAKKNFPIDHDRVVLCGVSMGGYGTWNVSLRHADRFAGASPLCGGLSRISQVGMKDERSWALLENAKLYPMLAMHGDKDGVVPYQPDKDAADRVKELGGDMKFHTLEGVGHDLKDAIMKGPLSEELITFVTTKKRNSHPAKVAYTSIDERNDGAYWLRIAKRLKGPDRARVEGSIEKGKNAVFLGKSDGVELARIYIDDKLLDLSKTVTVYVGDEARFQGKVTPDLKAILESWRSREDEKLVYPAFVEVDPR